MLYGMVCIGSFLYFLGKNDSGFSEILIRAGGVSLILSAFLGVLAGSITTSTRSVTCD